MLFIIVSKHTRETGEKRVEPTSEEEPSSAVNSKGSQEAGSWLTTIFDWVAYAPAR